MFEQTLLAKLDGRISLTPPQLAALRQHYELLVRWNAKLNLTSIRTMEEAVVRHYCESLFLGGLLTGASVCDLGSGAGFPGLPIAILRPDWRITLVESHQRKAVFLREAARAFSNVTVIDRRAKEIQGHFDDLVSRAVRSSDVLIQAKRLADRIGLLIGEADLKDCLEDTSIRWETPVKLPWGEQRWALLGNVPRGTSASNW